MRRRRRIWDEGRDGSYSIIARPITPKPVLATTPIPHRHERKNRHENQTGLASTFGI
jgi:hypothetical protein